MKRILYFIVASMLIILINVCQDSEEENLQYPYLTLK